MKRLIPAVIFSMLLVGTLVFSQGPRPPQNRPDQPPHAREGLREKLRLLDLTAEQRETIEAKRLELQKKIIPIRAQIELKQLDLRTAMKADKPGEAAILKIAREIHDLEFQIKELEIKQKLSFHSILTPEQREKLREPMPPPPPDMEE
jgi:Spy/CpxP family protein refolding chaperone